MPDLVRVLDADGGVGGERYVRVDEHCGCRAGLGDGRYVSARSREEFRLVLWSALVDGAILTVSVSSCELAEAVAPTS